MSKLYVDEIENLNGSIKPVKNIVAKVDTIIDLLQIDTSKLETGEQFHVLGYHTRNDGGGGIFYWDADMPKSERNGGTIIDPHNSQNPDTEYGCWVRIYDSDKLNVKWFGAMGDGQGLTPNDTDVDISNAYWNTWDGTPFKEDLSWSPFGTSGEFNPPREKPFSNDDTWDYIGISLALWQAKGVYLPHGDYRINFITSADRGFYNGILIMKGMSQTIQGAGKGLTIIRPKEDYNFFKTNNVGEENFYKLFSLYRVTAKPTVLQDFTILGSVNYTIDSKNLTLIYAPNVNGVVFRNLWLTSCHNGLYICDNSSDCMMTEVTAEYCFGAVVKIRDNSELRIDYCNFWSTSIADGQKGVDSDGFVYITNTNFVGFEESACDAGYGVFANNIVRDASDINLYPPRRAVKFTGDGGIIFANNTIQYSAKGTTQELVQIPKNASVVGNYLVQAFEHACLGLGDGTNSSAQNITIVGNTFKQLSTSTYDGNYAIVAVEQNVSFTGAATESVLIIGNSFEGRALQKIGNATLYNNVFNGVLQTNTVFTNNIVIEGDVEGKEILTGSAGTTDTYTITITNILGAGSGTSRDKIRLNLVCVKSEASGHYVKGYALYSSHWDGSSELIATLGCIEEGGTIQFGVNGDFPEVTITNTTENEPTYYVYSRPLI